MTEPEKGEKSANPPAGASEKAGKMTGPENTEGSGILSGGQ
jgi:hypothetical protein